MQTTNYVVLGRTFVLETLFSSENSLFIQLWKICIILSLYYYSINIVNTKILSLIFFPKTT